MDSIGNYHNQSLGEADFELIMKPLEEVVTKWSSYWDPKKSTWPSITYIVLNVICMAVVILWKKKLVSHVFILKLSSLILMNISHFEFIQSASLKSTNGSLAADMEVVNKHLDQIFLLMDQHLSLVLCHELFLCTVVIERSEYRLCRVITKAFAGAFIIVSLEIFTYVGALKLAKINFYYAHTLIFILRFLPSTIISVVIFVYGVRIIKALMSSIGFRGLAGMVVFVLGLICTTLIGQVTKFILNTISITREFQMSKEIDKCHAMVGPDIDDEAYAICLMESFAYADSYYISAEFGSAGEILFVLVMSLRELCQAQSL